MGKEGALPWLGPTFPTQMASKPHKLVWSVCLIGLGKNYPDQRELGAVHSSGLLFAHRKKTNIGKTPEVS